MKKLLIALLLGIVWLPSTATAQQWVEPHTRPDGTFVEGHWETPRDGWRNPYSAPGAFNPFRGRYNTYGRNRFGPSSNTSPVLQLYSGLPGSNAPNPYALPGSSTPNPYALPGSSPGRKVLLLPANPGL